MKGYVVSDNGKIVSNAVAEQFEEVLMDAVKESDTIGDGGDKELGRGKRRKQANRLYSTKFWMHGDDSSDEDI